MKTERSNAPQLVLQELVLSPAGEWFPKLPGWSLIQVVAGTGYWLHPRLNQELQTGSVLILSDQVRGCIRASQLGGITLNYFCMEPSLLVGLVSLGDQRFFETAAARDDLSLRIFPPASAVAERFGKLGAQRDGNHFPFRLQLLQLAVESFGNELKQQKLEPADTLDAKQRLWKRLEQMPAAELLSLNFTDLVQHTRCTPRHLSRIFQEVVGMSFREKQAEVRLARARELLATSESKVVDVALESGYQSLSLFNQMFKRHFGVSPGKWREQFKSRRPSRRIQSRSRLVSV